MRILAFLLLIVPAVAIAGQGTAPCTPVVETGWVRMAPGMPMGAAFAVVRNPCRVQAEIVSAGSPAFADVSLHETRIENGMSRMRAVPRVVLPAGGTVELKPGGLHVMLMQPRGQVRQGSRVRLEFVLADGRRVFADVPVRATAP
ncbi:MAG: copper chaperone PCu(A)C [Pseudomonadota bacterium]